MTKSLSLVLAMALGLSAQTFNVSSTSELRTALSEAVSNADVDDTINLAAGIYRTADDAGGYFQVRNVTLVGSTEGETILSGGNTDTVVGGYNSRLENLTITEGNNFNDSQRGAGVVGNNFTLVNCKVINNRGDYWATYGTGLHGDNSIIINSLFDANTGSNYGAHVYGSSVIAINSTFIGKDSLRDVGIYDDGVYDPITGEYNASNGALNNNAFIDSNFYLQYGGSETANAYYAMADVDSIFSDYYAGDVTLKSGSALVDAGTADTLGTLLPAEDMAGNARIQGTAIDIGPYEANAAQSTTVIMRSADFNGDGFTDLLVRNDNLEQLWYVSAGGTVTKVDFDIPDDVTVVAYGDFNADGITDLMVRNGDETMSFWFLDQNAGITAVPVTEGSYQAPETNQPPKNSKKQ